MWTAGLTSPIARLLRRNAHERGRAVAGSHHIEFRSAPGVGMQPFPPRSDTYLVHMAAVTAGGPSTRLSGKFDLVLCRLAIWATQNSRARASMALGWLIFGAVALVLSAWVYVNTQVSGFYPTYSKLFAIYLKLLFSPLYKDGSWKKKVGTPSAVTPSQLVRGWERGSEIHPITSACGCGVLLCT